MQASSKCLGVEILQMPEHVLAFSWHLRLLAGLEGLERMIFSEVVVPEK